MRYLLAGLIVAYRATLSPLFPPSCRFYPTCSQYAKQAVLKHGSLRGVYLAARRIVRCNPWNPGGVDLVP
jgi:putative membrane protein insertion efficiency factor